MGIGTTGLMSRIYCVLSCGLKSKLKLLLNGTDIRLETGFCDAFAKSVVSSAMAWCVKRVMRPKTRVLNSQ